MPLGASITAGYKSNPYNGYRKAFRDEMRFRGYPVNMVRISLSGHEIGHP